MNTPKDVPDQTNHLTEVMKQLYRNYQRKKFCDVDIVCSSKRYPAHKVVLTANSNYFLEILKNDVKEVIITTSKDEIEPIAIESLLCFFYTGAIDNLKIEHVNNILMLSHLIDQKNVAEYCYRFLEEQLKNMKNIIHVYQLALHYNCNTQLTEKAKNLILSNFAKIMNHEDYVLLKTDQLQDLLSSDSLAVESEKDAFEGLKLWWKHFEHGRRNDFCSLLQQIRFAHVSPKYLVNEILPNLDKCDTCIYILKDVLAWNVLPHERKSLKPMNTKLRHNESTLLAIFGNQIKKYDLTTQSWLPYFLIDRIENDSSISILWNDKYMIFGGCATKKVQCGSLFTNAIIPMPQMLQQRKRPAAAIINGRIFVCGGYMDKNILKTVEEWDPSKLKWTNVKDMNVPLSCHQTAVYNDKIYVFGNDFTNKLNSAQVYDPSVNEWKSLPNMINTKFCYGTAVKDNEIFVIGKMYVGKDSSSVEVFDTSSETWKSITSPPEIMNLGRIVNFQNQITCFGNKHSYVYNSKTNIWNILPNKDLDNANAFIFSVPSHILSP